MKRKEYVEIKIYKHTSKIVKKITISNKNCNLTYSETDFLKAIYLKQKQNCSPKIHKIAKLVA